MQVKDYNLKVDELLKKITEDKKQVEGIILEDKSNVGFNVMNINGLPTIVFTKINEKGEPSEIIYCISVSDMESAKRLNIWSSNIMSVLTQKALYNADANTLVSGAIAPSENKTEEKK